MKHDFSGACIPARAFASQMTFSVGVYEVLPKASGKGTKHGKVKVRISGMLSNPEAVYVKANEVVRLLDQGKYSGPKHIDVAKPYRSKP